jgi:hypothetical protein
MNFFLLSIAALVLLFGFVILFGAPYLPTLSVQKKLALDMLDLKPGETMLELGSGDGRMLKAAAERGWKAIGYELNPLLVLLSLLITWKYRKQVKVVWGNYWLKAWPKAEGIYTFLLQKYMSKLDTKIAQEYSHPVKLVSFAFSIPNRKHVQEQKGLFLYKF